MARSKGPLAGFEVVGTKMVLEDGSSHAVDSSDLAFQICARTAFRQAVRAASPVILEPIMRVEVEVPMEFQGAVAGDLASRPPCTSPRMSRRQPPQMQHPANKRLTP